MLGVYFVGDPPSLHRTVDSTRRARVTLQNQALMALARYDEECGPPQHESEIDDGLRGDEYENRCALCMRCIALVPGGATS